MVARAETTTPSHGQSLDLDAWLGVVSEGRSDAEQQLIRAALTRAQAAHKNQMRASGEPYLLHCLAVAEIVHHLKLDHEAVAAAILHDAVEDTDVTLEEVAQTFGGQVARLVDGVTKMGRIGEMREPAAGRRSTESSHSESVRKLLLAMAEDVRVVLIKLADRLHNMRTLRFLDEERQRRIARETLDIYAPLANRLGIWQVKWELEDLSLRYLEPDAYHRIAALLDGRRIDRERHIDLVKERLTKAFDAAGIRAEISGRPKHIYSIWRKMQRKNIDFHEIFDVQAVRVLVESTAECYAALGIVHTLWHHVPHEFDDYIANPKSNNYRSLHTAVIGPEGRAVEVQIRTREMHEHAELGIAAHWRYKEGARYDQGFEKKVAWLRQLLEWKEEEPSADEFVDRFKSESVEERVYVLTPQGQVIDMPAGATVLDFAYHIHTDVGHRCRGAKVNGRIVPLAYELSSGEQVEVLTGRKVAPSRDWLNPHLGYLKTSRARAKVRHWIKQQDRDINIAAGRSSLERELHRLGLSISGLPEVAERLKFPDADSMMAALGRGDLQTHQVVSAVMGLGETGQEQPISFTRQARRPVQGKVRDDFRILGVGNLLTQAARCCRPVPNDVIVGYITRGRGVTIHRRDCANILRLKDEDRDRLIDVEWGDSPDRLFPVDIQIQAYDRPGLLRDVSAVLANDKINVLGMHTRTDKKDLIATMELHAEVTDMGQLSRVLSRIGQLPNIIEVRRKV
ncbi:MAG: GTP diphosphokinase [Gammaproteobacteria bacterium]|nr:MAG: GTP diphosphokinase [Gammaproteobacteria bacterium]